jgi:hypothetical protein
MSFRSLLFISTFLALICFAIGFVPKPKRPFARLTSHNSFSEVIQHAIENVGVIGVIATLPVSFAYSKKVRYGHVETCNIAKRYTIMANPFPPAPTTRTVDIDAPEDSPVVVVPSPKHNQRKEKV